MSQGRCGREAVFAVSWDRCGREAVFAVSRRGGSSDSLPLGPAVTVPERAGTSSVHYPVTAATRLVNVSGAGDW